MTTSSRADEIAATADAGLSATLIDPMQATAADLGPAFSATQGASTSSPVDRTLAAEHANEVVLAAGARAGRYIFLERLGAGAMGLVWSAWDPELDRRVAIKMLAGGGAPAGPDERGRLQREAMALARLAHPNVVSIFDVVVDEGRLFVAMELIDGWTLRDWVRTQRPSREDRLAALLAAGRGMEAAHGAGLVHRDLKPDNVMIGRDGRVRVTDFGLAKTASERDTGAPVSDLDEARSSALTQVGSILGTPAYLAPELYLGGEADVRSDIFAFATTAWELLCGQRPYLGDSLSALRQAITSGRITAPPADTPLTRHERSVLGRGLEVEPARRWPDMRSLLDALASDPRRNLRRRLMLVGGGLVGIAAIAGGVAREGAAERRCRDPEVQLAGTWDGPRRDALAAVFAASGSSISESTWLKVQDHVNLWTDHWVGVAAPACLGESTLALDLRPAQVRCLAERRAALDALLGVFQAADVEVVSRAQAAVAGLGDPRRCADPVLLAAAIAPPPPEHADEVERLERVVARATALRSAGSLAAAEAAIRELLGDIERVAYPPLDAAAQMVLGDLLEERSAFGEATERYTVALERALAAHDEHRAARTAVRLGGLLGARRRLDAEATLTMRLAAALVRAIGDPAELVVEYQHVQGMIALGRNESAKAREWFEKEVADRRALDPDSPAIGSALAGLAIAARGEGKLAELADLAAEARAHYERTLVPGHPEIAAAIDREGAVRFEQGRISEARERFEEAVNIRRAVLGATHPLTIASEGNLAGMLMMLGDKAGAEVLYREALDAGRQAFEPGDARTGELLTNLALILSERGQIEAARALYVEGLAVIEAAYGPDDPKLAWQLLNFADNRRRAGEHAEALALSQRSATIREKVLGPNHPHLAMSLRAVGIDQKKAGDLDAAIASFTRAIEIWERALGPDHPDVARGRFSLAGALLARKDLAGAEREAKRTREIFDVPDAVSPDQRGELHAFLGELAVERGALAEARGELERALEIYGAEASTGRADAERQLAAVLLRQREPAAARAMMARALADLERAGANGAGDPEALALVRGWLAAHP